MNTKLKNLLRPSNLLYLVGFLIVFAELIFNLQGKSLCHTEGCRIVESFVRGGEVILLLSGILLFGTLFVISYIKKYEILHSLILISALSIEGYLVGFQSFIIKEFCLFCIVVFSILVIASILRIMSGRKEVAIAFISFGAIFITTFLVNPKLNEFPPSKYLLIYSKECPTCKEIVQYCKELKIPVDLIEAKEIGGILKSLNINSVPVLYCNENTERKFIIGPENIKEYLVAKATPKQESAGDVCPIFAPSECK